MPPQQADQYSGQTNNNSSSYYGGYDSSSGYSGGSSNYDTNSAITRYQKELEDIKQKLIALGTANAGWEREKLEAQREDAQKALDNAYKIAQLQSDTQRYGYDQSRQTAIDQLKENARQFDKNHELEQQKVGLDYAKTATDYLSTPDKYFQGSNYLNMASRVFANQTGSSTVGKPVAKTEQDFANLASGGTGQSSGGGTTYSASSSGSTSPSQVATNAASAGGSGSDARVKALKSVIDSVGVSTGSGLDSNDQAVLAAAQAIYSTNLNPGQYQTIANSPTNRGITRSAISRLGDNPDEWEARQRRNQIGAGSARAA